ncbi:MAG: hypothetical protein H6719_07200 [Sandaracinaceae bacterium]|nr:hypothetical protein [Sandaracinaceae bacterium]
MRTAPCVLLLVLAATASSGCLSSGYFVPHDELIRLANTPPAARGDRVRVVQATFGGRPGSGYRAVQIDPMQAAALGIAIHDAHRDFAAAARSLESGSSGGASSGSDDGSAGPAEGGRGSERSSGPDVSGEGAGIALLVVGAAVLLTGGIVLLSVLAATEGSRFDGWVRVDPGQTLYLDYATSRIAMPLWMLTDEYARAASQAMIVEDEAPIFEHLEEAPLDRVGPTVALDFGASGTAAQGAFWPELRVGIGGFFLQQLGVLATFTGVFGAEAGNLLLNLRYGGEIQAYPLEVSLFSLGLYASAFDNHRAQELPMGGGLLERHAFGWSAGLAMQLAVTTRIAVTLRGGPVVVHEPGNDVVTGEVTIGGAVY